MSKSFLSSVKLGKYVPNFKLYVKSPSGAELPLVFYMTTAFRRKKNFENPFANKNVTASSNTDRHFNWRKPTTEEFFYKLGMH